MSEYHSIPLLRDHHNHFVLYGLLKGCVNLVEVRDKEQALARLSGMPRDKISIVLGWNSGYYSFSEEDQRRLPPLLIYNLSLHSLCLTTPAREELRKKYPEIVENYASSQWYEANFSTMMKLIPEFTSSSLETFWQFYEELKGKGIYQVQEMLLPSDQIFDLIFQSELKDRVPFWADLNTFKALKPFTREHLQGIKFFTDGALGAYTAAMKQPYKNGRRGILLFKDEELYNRLSEAGRQGQAISVHAIGDEANAQAIRVLKDLAAAGITFPRVRLEHCQFISPENARTARELGIILSMQPNFNTDNYFYTDRLNKQQLSRNNPFRMLIDQAGFRPGVDLIFGSDGMPHGAQAALSAALFPPLASQRLSLQELVQGYCLESEEWGKINLELSARAVRVRSVEH